jgi:hypothetical protein
MSRQGFHCRLKASTCVALVAAIASVLPAVAESKPPQPIYFFTNTAQPINKQNPLVIRPKGFLLFQDGQWVLERLRWTGWGASVARATGVSSSSNDIPNAAEGKRIKTWAHVTLSSPGRFRGHEVYRCFTLAVPPPASDMHICLGHAHSVYILEPAKQPASTPKVSNPPAFYARPPGGFITCGFASGVSEAQLVRCQGAPAGTNPLENVATLQSDGQVETCSRHQMEVRCFEGNVGEGTPTLSAGEVDTQGPFTCKVLATGVECTVTATGKGFVITSEAVTEVGG